MPEQEVLAGRSNQRGQRVQLARTYVNQLSDRLEIVAAAVVGSVARGDFNVWSDIDVVIVAERLPARLPDRSALLALDAPGGVQPIGFTPDEFREALRRSNPLAQEAMGTGIVLRGQWFFRSAGDWPKPRSEP